MVAAHARMHVLMSWQPGVCPDERALLPPIRAASSLRRGSDRQWQRTAEAARVGAPSCAAKGGAPSQGEVHEAAVATCPPASLERRSVVLPRRARAPRGSLVRGALRLGHGSVAAVRAPLQGAREPVQVQLCLIAAGQGASSPLSLARNADRGRAGALGECWRGSCVRDRRAAPLPQRGRQGQGGGRWHTSGRLCRGPGARGGTCACGRQERLARGEL